MGLALATLALVLAAGALELLPETPELVWGLVAFVLSLGLVVLALALIIRVARRRRPSGDVDRRLDRLEARLAELEDQDRSE